MKTTTKTIRQSKYQKTREVPCDTTKNTLYSNCIGAAKLLDILFNRHKSIYVLETTSVDNDKRYSIVLANAIRSHIKNHHGIVYYDEVGIIGRLSFIYLGSTKYIWLIVPAKLEDAKICLDIALSKLSTEHSYCNTDNGLYQGDAVKPYHGLIHVTQTDKVNSLCEYVFQQLELVAANKPYSRFNKSRIPVLVRSGLITLN
jgi:hypothetical protein